MTLLARSDKNKSGYKGLSMFLAPKTPGMDNEAFPDNGIKGWRDRSARVQRYERV